MMECALQSLVPVRMLHGHKEGMPTQLQTTLKASQCSDAPRHTRI
jgi:hypothetical protein